MTGLAEQDDVDQIADLMRKVEQGVHQAADAWQSGTSHFTAALQLEKARVDNIYALLAMQRQSMLRFQSQFLELYLEDKSKFVLMAQMSELLASSIFQISQIDELFQAVQLLTINKLPHFFVSHATLTKSLDYLQ